MKKFLSLILAIMFVALLAACSQPEVTDSFKDVTFADVTTHYNGEAHALTVGGTLPEGATVTYENNTATEEGTYDAKATLRLGDEVKILTAKLTVKEPTAEQVVAARQSVVAETTQSFNYQYKLVGALQLLGIEGDVEGVYTGQYREDTSTGDFGFKRETSGELLPDSVKYVYNKGNQLITLKMADDGSIKKISNETVDKQDGFFVHKPIEAFVNSIDKDKIEKIAISSDVAGFKYKATLRLTSDNPYIARILDAVAGLGANISLKGVEIPNLANGIQLYFNYGKGGRIDDFYVSINLTVPIKVGTASITLSYDQHGDTTPLQIPQDSSFIVGDTEIGTLVSQFNDAMLALKASDAYSLDVMAANDFDPSWKVAATVDKYTARLYKNTVEGDVYFNHSYEFKAHHETDGAETYKYTLGNVIGEDAGIYLVSRKGKNDVAATNGNYSADTQFDFLSAMAIINPAHVDCIKIVQDGDKTTYRIYLSKASVIAIQQKILDIVNSNDAEGVVDVNNYLNSTDYIFEEAVVEVTVKNGALAAIKCETEIRYTPTGGDYTEYVATLKNTIELEINKKLDDAQEYTAPDSKGVLVGIGAAKYYIL